MDPSFLVFSSKIVDIENIDPTGRSISPADSPDNHIPVISRLSIVVKSHRDDYEYPDIPIEPFGPPSD